MSTTKTSSDLLEHAEKLGLSFRDMSLFRRALTHSSYLNEHPEEILEDNERLEFLGDAVLDFLAAEWLFERLPDLEEGSLTRLRAGMVRNDSLAHYAAALHLGEMLLMGKGEEEGGGRERRRTLSSTLEAILGALYLDQGIEAVRVFIQPWFVMRLEMMQLERSDKDAKSRLQEWSQSALNQIPKYRIVEMTGPEHAPEFTTEVIIGEEIFGRGNGHSKRTAAQSAARAALANLEQKGLLT